MIRPTLNQVTFWFLLATIGLLPVAHLKLTLGGFPLYFPEITVIGALVSFLVSRERLMAPTEIDRMVSWGLTLFLLGAGLTFFLNPWSLTGLGMLKSWFVFPLLFGGLMLQVCRNYQREQMVMGTVLATLTLIALRSLYLAITGEMTYDGRLAGDYASPNFLAFLMALGLAFAFGLFEKKLPIGLYGPSLVIAVLAIGGVLLLTRSYGAILSVALVTLGWGLWYARQSFVRIMVGIILLTATLGTWFLLESGSDKWQSLVTLSERSSFASREMIWRAAWHIARENPLGIGVGRFQDEYLSSQAFFPPFLEWAVPEPHNLLLAVFFAVGPIGLLGFLILIGRILLLLFRSQRSTPQWLLVCWTLFFLMGLLDTPLFKTDLSYLFALMLALSLVAITKKPPEGHLKSAI